ncbi:MAG: class I SAM-dependent methyltransferase [Bacillota bacterium]
MENSATFRQAIEDQYKTPEHLKTRGNLHSFNTNKVDWDKWCFDRMQIPRQARILELGCGTGSFWFANRCSLGAGWDITLSDLSIGMLESARVKLGQVHDFSYAEIDAQNIPYEDESFDVIIARHMLYLVPDIAKALSEIKRVLVKGGTLYATTNSRESMSELNALVEGFDAKMDLHNNGMGDRFDMEGGYLLLRQYFDEAHVEVLTGRIVVDDAAPVVAYKASTLKGSVILVGEKKEQFTRHVEEHILKNGSLSITTKSCMFTARK